MRGELGWQDPVAPSTDTRRVRRRLALLAVGCALLGWAAESEAQIYVGLPARDGDAVVLSNFASEQSPKLLIAVPPDPVHALGTHPPPSAERRAASKAAQAYAPLIGEIAHDVGLSPLLIHAVIAAESNYDPRAVSAKGALGLMQLLPDTARRFGVKQPFDPRENVRGGAQYLRWLADRFGNRVDLVLAAYNAGEGLVERAGRRVPDLAETQAYVRNVLARVSCSTVSACEGAAQARL